MYITTYSCMSAYINMDVNTYIHKYTKHVSLHTYTYSNKVTLA